MRADGIRTVAGQEFRLRIRAGRWKLLLVAWFAVLALLTALLHLAASQVDDLVDEGTIVYGGLVLLVLGLALLVVPSLAAQSVNGDRERGTLAALQVTRLSAGEIALGKFAAAWGTALLFVALSLPLALFAVTQGGVTPGRLLVVYTVLSLLLGTVCALSLWLSSALARTTTSGLLAYLAVAVLSIGTLVVFGLATVATQEHYTQTYNSLECTDGNYPDGPYDEADPPAGCTTTPQTYDATRTRTDRTWWLLAPNPFVVLGDAAPALPADPPGLSEPQQRARQERRDLDPLGQIGRGTRRLRQPPEPAAGQGSATNSSGLTVTSSTGYAREDGTPPRQLVWPYGLAFDVALGVGTLVLTTRRLRTPSRHLPRGQRVA